MGFLKSCNKNTGADLFFLNAADLIHGQSIKQLCSFKAESYHCSKGLEEFSLMSAND